MQLKGRCRWPSLSGALPVAKYQKQEIDKLLEQYNSHKVG